MVRPFRPITRPTSLGSRSSWYSKNSGVSSILMVKASGVKSRVYNCNNEIFNRIHTSTYLKNYFWEFRIVEFLHHTSFWKDVVNCIWRLSSISQPCKNVLLSKLLGFFNKWIVSSNCFDETSITWWTWICNVNTVVRFFLRTHTSQNDFLTAIFYKSLFYEILIWNRQAYLAHDLL